jgi:F-type H+-transporting ATPase subunit epsilon
MKTFPLKIVTADGIRYDGEAEELVVRTTTGDIGILAGHINCVAPLGMGRAMVVIDGKKRYGACIGGMVSVIGGCVRLVPATFEWAEQIDLERAERSFTDAKAILANKDASDAQLRLAEARLRRALVRKGVGSAQ